MDIESLKKKKELMESNFKQLNERIKIDTENALRIQGAILGINEIIAEDEKIEKDKKKK